MDYDYDMSFLIDYKSSNESYDCHAAVQPNFFCQLRRSVNNSVQQEAKTYLEWEILWALPYNSTLRFVN